LRNMQVHAVADLSHFLHCHCKAIRVTAASAFAMKKRDIVEFRTAVSRLWRANAYPVLISITLVTVVTICLMFVQEFVLLHLIPLVYVIPVIIAATRWGIVPALSTAVVSAAASDFFFIPPLYSLWIYDPQEAIDLILFLFVAVVTSNLAARLRREVDLSHRREKEIRLLYGFSRRLAGCFTTSDLYPAIEDFLADNLGHPVVLIETGAELDGKLRMHSRVALPQRALDEVAEMMAANEFHARTIVDPATQQVWLLRSTSSDTIEYGIIAANLNHDLKAVKDLEQHIDIILGEVAATFKRLNMSRTIGEAKLRTQVDLFKEVLIGTVSHELRTPLASILASAGILCQAPEIMKNDRLSLLVQATHDEAERLNGEIQKLLDATRTTARGVRPKLNWVDPTDIVNAAIAQRRSKLATHELDVEISEDLPLVQVDTVLMEQALGQLLENSAKYSLKGTTIRVSARAEDRRVVLSVRDNGVGFKPSEKSLPFRQRFRGQQHRAPAAGAGLGLWIANAFVAANGGTLDFTSRGQGLGTTASIYLPAASDVVRELAEHVDE
jgi:K+-sensing histidine kinase KdpD